MLIFVNTLREFSAVAFTAGIVFALFPSQGFLVRPCTGKATAFLAQCLVIVLFLASFYKFSLHFSYAQFSSVSILNTDMIINSASLFVAAALLIAVVPVLAHLLTMLGKRMIRLSLFIVLAMIFIRWSAEVTLGLLELNLWDASAARVSFVAKIGHLFPLMIYIEMALFAFLLLAFFCKRRALLQNESVEIGINRRKSEYSTLIEKRWMKSALLIIVAIVVPLLYQDLYAGRAPKLSPAVAVASGEDGVIRIRMDDVKNGELHRFSAISKSGKQVRFFVINRGKSKDFGVAFDACALCADKGYIKKSRHVICLACGSLIFIPSIGRSGGCNPIPLKYEVMDDMILIKPEDLDAGAKYFGFF